MSAIRPCDLDSVHNCGCPRGVRKARVDCNQFTHITGRAYFSYQKKFSWCQTWLFFVLGRHDELVSEGGVYADMWLQQQKAEEKEKHGSVSDSVEEEKDDK